MSSQFFYFAYGLHIRADFALWPWGARESQRGPVADVVVELVASDEVLPELGFGPGRRDAVLDWPGVGVFRIERGERIAVRPDIGSTIDEIALIAAGAAFALLLEQRGHAILHGSCVRIGDEAIALLGPSGSGKSTTAATLRDRGHSLLSDGMTVVDLSNGDLLALPGPPHFKLWPDAAQSLSVTPSSSHPIARHEEKRWYDARGGVAIGPARIRRVYLLAPGRGVQLEPLSSAAALVGLVQNYFLADFADRQGREFILHRCAKLAAGVAVCRLRRGEVLSDLPAVLAELERSG